MSFGFGDNYILQFSKIESITDAKQQYARIQNIISEFDKNYKSKTKENKFYEMEDAFSALKLLDFDKSLNRISKTSCEESIDLLKKVGTFPHEKELKLSNFQISVLNFITKVCSR